MAYISSRCVPARDNFVFELSKRFKIHSFGECLHNADADELFPECRQYVSSKPHDPNWRKKKHCILKNFKFLLSVENTLDAGYVTEKFFDGLYAPVIPVYLGACDADRFSPGDHAFIDVSKFNSVERLGTYLNLLDQNEHLYKEYFTWKSKPVLPSYQWIQQHNVNNMSCLLCEYLSKLPEG